MKTGKKRRRKKDRPEKTQGDAIYYFLLHNIFSMILFFMLTYNLGLYSLNNDSVITFFTFGFWDLMLRTFGIYLIAGALGRLLGFILMSIFYKYIRKKAMKRFGDLNRGINKISFTFIIASLVSAFVYSFGVILIIQEALFGTNTLASLVITYMVVKAIVYLSVRGFAQLKL